MPMIHVARDGAKLGEFSLEQIRQGLATGQFRSTDLGWQNGMSEWRPLSEFPGATAAAPGAVPALVSQAVPGSGLPWENRQQIGLVKAWLDTVTLLIGKPGEAFRIMRPEGGLTDPLLFGLIGGCAGSVVSMLFQGLMQSIPGFAGRNDISNLFGIGHWAFIIIYAVLSPLLVVMGLFLGGAILHLCLMLVGGANRSFETTFRVVCFAGGAANLFSIIPMCGGMVAGVYQIVLNCIGLTQAQQTTTGKALMAIFLPLLICCGVCIIFGILIGGFGGLSELLNKH